MKIALVFPQINRRGGVERVLLEAANFLQSRGHHVHLFANDYESRSLNDQVTTHDVPSASRVRLLNSMGFRKRCADRMASTNIEFDVMGTCGVLAPDDAVVWVQSVHAAWIDIARSQRGLLGRLKQRFNPFHPCILRREAYYFRNRRYRKLIALTERVKSDLVRYYGVPEDDIVVVNNGFNPTEFSTDVRRKHRERVRHKLGYRSGDRVIVFVANELERKGFGPLLRAVHRLNDPSLHLLAVGKLNAASYADEIGQLGMTNRVQFTGPTSNVAHYYAGSDLFALPTTYEAWGLVIVEAMACGLPALTSRLAGAAVAVREGQTGELLDDPSDVGEVATKLRTLLERGTPTPQAISDSVRDYAWPNMLERYERVMLNAAG